MGKYQEHITSAPTNSITEVTLMVVVRAQPQVLSDSKIDIIQKG